MTLIQDPVSLFFAFLVLHTLADFPLQGDYLARQKVRKTASSQTDWLMALSAHSVLHAGGVWLLTGSLALGVTEFFLHWLIDLAKGEGKFGVLMDQSLHMLCKLAYVLILAYGSANAAMPITCFP
jgi:hypothetical protein